MTTTLILGGVRSGKSALGESLLPASARYIATTSTVQVGRDDEFAARLAAHRARRPSGWTTVENSDVATELVTGSAPTIVDDLGGWLTGECDRLGAWDSPDDLSDSVTTLVAAIAQYPGDLVIISPEVGLSVVPATRAGRVFQDQLGALNSAVAAVCDAVHLVVAGIATTLKGQPVNGQPLNGVQPIELPAPPISTTQTPAPPIPTPVSKEPRPTPRANGGSYPLPDRFDAVVPPDADVRDAARARHALLTKPAGSLGRIEELGVWAASCQGQCPPKTFTRPRIVIFAGDHGVAASGVSAYPQEVTAQMVANFVAGNAAINVLARIAGASVRVEDISVASDTSPELSTHKLRRSSGDLSSTDALTYEQASAAIAVGRRIADDEIDSGADLLVAGDMGIANTTPASILIGIATNTEPVAVVGRGTGIDDAGWIRKTAAIRDGMRRARPYVRDPKALLRTVAGADIAAMAGFLAQAALRQTPVILDGVVVTAAALVANDMAVGAREWWVASHVGVEPAHAIALKQLGLEPILDLGLRLGEGSGATLAIPIIQSAVAILEQMATFDEAGVSASSPASV